jgi:CRISPR-associated endonuclease/helicase Cas3
MVVDRRVVVDQAAVRGRKLLAALTAATGGVLEKVRDALALFSGPDEEPLAVYALRGGIPKDDGWARSPSQPLIVASTVDQLGSRLLVQGYGVSPRMRPVHAGLAANDILILLDEVHLSQPFQQTLERLDGLRGRFAGLNLPRRFNVAFLSATPGETREQPFRLQPDELAPTSALGPRLHAPKLTRIEKVAGRTDLATRVTREVTVLRERHTVVAAVLNRVDSALQVYRNLQSVQVGQVVLVTGRMRPLDRDDVMATLGPRISAGERRRSGDGPGLVVVGTQAIEAGADFDFDAIVTESASFDALRQRFGRVDRLGEYKDNKGLGRAEGVIVHDKTEKSDAIYGTTIVETVKWLEARLDKKTRRVDFGSRSLLDVPPSLLAPKANAPALLPAYLDLWSQTSPEPSAVPEPGLFLHGPRSGPEDVQVVWRADVEPGAFTIANEAALVAAVAAVRPSALEAVSLPFVAVRRWLAGEKNSLEGTTDVEIKADSAGDAGEHARTAFRWRGSESRIVIASEVRPGDTLIVPHSYGGIDPATKCFDPESRSEVADLAERASLMSRGRPLLRLHPRILAGLGIDVEREDAEAARNSIRALVDTATGWMRPWTENLAKGRKAHVVQWNGAGIDGWTVMEGRLLTAARLREAMGESVRDRGSVEGGCQATTDDEDSPYVGVEVGLDAHIRDVERRVRSYAELLGLPPHIVSDLSLAAWLHDIGKADQRFQQMVRGGSPISYYRHEGELLAKSAMSADSWTERRRAQALSGYPRGMRHEVQSLAMMESARPAIAPLAHDLDLVMHLVASHHGFGRPFAPAVQDQEPVDVSLDAHTSETFGTLVIEPTTSAHGLHRLDSPLADRFWSLTAKYGWLELCWLEAIFRLADHRASEAEIGDGR